MQGRRRALELFERVTCFLPRATTRRLPPRAVGWHAQRAMIALALLLRTQGAPRRRTDDGTGCQPCRSDFADPAGAAARPRSDCRLRHPRYRRCRGSGGQDRGHVCRAKLLSSPVAELSANRGIRIRSGCWRPAPMAAGWKDIACRPFPEVHRISPTCRRAARSHRAANL